MVFGGILLQNISHISVKMSDFCYLRAGNVSKVVVRAKKKENTRVSSIITQNVADEDKKIRFSWVKMKNYTTEISKYCKNTTHRGGIFKCTNFRCTAVLYL